MGGGSVWIWGLNLSKAVLPFLPFFAVLRNSLILPHQWRSTEKSRPLHCQPLRVPVLFDSVFCGSLDTPSFFFPTPPHTPLLFGSSIIPLTRFWVGMMGGGILRGGWREDREVCHRVETVKGLSLLAASQGEPKSHRTIWSLQTIKLLFFFSLPVFLSFICLKKLSQTFAFTIQRQGGHKWKMWPNSSAPN